MNVTEEILDGAKRFSGGVAISTHPHLEKYWTKAVELYINKGVRTNLHVIISDKKSVDKFLGWQSKKTAISL
jgi:hypothetical protein